VMRDITERLRAAQEWRQLEDWVQRAQRFESLGLMASGIAHDFNNLLTPILGDASLALIDLPPESPVRSRLIRIQRAAHRAATLTHQLLDYAGMGSLETEPVDLSKLVHEMAELLQSAAATRTPISFDLAPDLPWVRADTAQLSQVVMNLITNAAEALDDAGPEGSRIEVRSGTTRADRDALAQMFLGEDLPEGTYAYLEVEDGGCGMDAATRARVFDPFFTTKFTGRGLGLAAVLGIVRKHRGAIAMESAPGRGTCIRVLLPLAGGGSPPRTAAAPPPLAGWRGSGTILVADDDEGARELLSETLVRAGFTVLCASDGGEAAETFRRRADEIRLVLLDRTMPGASGDEALAAIHAVRADVPVVLVSGYSRESASELLASDRAAGFLQKPFLPDDLVRRIREILGD
jgi:two-component system cell cycle sensor histidine kinase/response regulator CckA